MHAGDSTGASDMAESSESFASTSDSSGGSSSSSSSSSTSAATVPTASTEPLEELLRVKDEKEAEGAKARGNALYANRDYAGAIHAYGEALLLCPSERVSLQSVLLSNRAAAHLLSHDYEATIADCTASLALADTPKARLRRSTAYEKTGKPAEAIADLRSVIAAGHASREDSARLRRLEADKAASDERMKAEMLGKLKDLGNGLLGKIGMSLDNFKAVKDEHTGSYSISFQK